MLALLIAILPAQVLAAIVAPLCPRDGATVPDYGIHGVHQLVKDVVEQDQPLTIGDVGSDHCGAGSVIALPATRFGWAGDPALQRGSATATRYSGFIPEQPQRPPLV